MRNSGYLLKKDENYGHYFGKMWQKLPRKAKDMECRLMISLHFDEVSLHCSNMEIFVSILQNYG